VKPKTLSKSFAKLFMKLRREWLNISTKGSILIQKK